MYTYLVYVEKPGFTEIYIVPNMSSGLWVVDALKNKYADLKDITLDKFSCLEVNTPLYITSHRTQEG